MSSHSTPRKTTFKLPPVVSQETRRAKALEEQKRRRTTLVDSTRQLDLFAGLTLGGDASDDDDAPILASGAGVNAGEDEDKGAQRTVAPASIAQYASLLHDDAYGSNPTSDSHVSNAISNFGHTGTSSGTGLVPHSSGFTAAPSSSQAQDASMSNSTPSAFSSKKQKSKANSNNRRRNNKPKPRPSKWADKCMYAELLEMVDVNALDASSHHLVSSYSDLTMDDREYSSPGIASTGEHPQDGLPPDIETAWVAVAPVPVGKRCLAVTHQSSSNGGGGGQGPQGTLAPNTSLRTRLLGKPILLHSSGPSSSTISTPALNTSSLPSPAPSYTHYFPTPLPPHTILDCILDPNWASNGILHVLDVVMWKGQDLGGCEAGMRFWWRDTRLAEIASLSPPQLGGGTASGESSSSVDALTHPPYSFPYPTTLLPIPYHTSTTLEALDRVVVPAARTVRVVDVRVPMPRPVGVSVGVPLPAPPIVGDEAEGGMDIETPTTSAPGEFTFGPTTTSFAAPPSIQATITTHHQIAPDGLLLYLAEASYEPGTSPLSSWVPLRGYEEGGDGHTCEKEEDRDGKIGKEEKEGPLDLFQRLVRRRLARRYRQQQQQQQQQQGMGGSSNGGELVNADVDMDI